MLAAKRWQVILATSIRGTSVPFDDESVASLFSDMFGVDKTVLRFMLRPVLRLVDHGFVADPAALPGRPDAEVSWNAGEWMMTDRITRAVSETDPGERSLASVLEDALMNVYDLLDAYHGNRGFDSITSLRAAIEEHPQDASRRKPLDAVIDGLRDFGIKALRAMPDLPDRWWSFDRALMQRLALHLVANDPARSADDKLSWLLDRTGLYTRYLKHETYQLLRVVVTASPSVKERVLKAVEAGPCYPEGETEYGR